MENPKVTSINFKGNTAVTWDKLDLLMTVRPQEILNLRKLNGDLERILKYYYNEGYSAKIKDVNISEQGDVTIELAELRVADVRIEGHKKTKDYVVQRYISVRPVNCWISISSVRISENSAISGFSKVLI